MGINVEKEAKILRQCQIDYETDGTSQLTDEEYDTRMAALRKVAPDHQIFKNVGGLDLEHVYGTPVKHTYIMGSLQKDPDTKAFESWLKKTYPDLNGVVVVLQLKVDGSSFSLIYKDGKLQLGASRGDGITGIDYTKNARYIAGVHPTIPCKGEIEIRGEVFKDRKDFYARWVGEYKNPRNFTAGGINQKDPKVTKERGLEFVAYEVKGKAFRTEEEKLAFLVKMKFQTLKDSTAKINCTGKTHAQVAKAVQKFMDRVDRPNLPFDVDGIVFKLNDISKAESMGTTDSGRRPKANRAVKFPCEQKETTLIGIEENVGRTGSITPVGLLKPVELAGTTVQRVSLNNYKFIREMGLKIGATVLMQKSGDIIPYVVKMTKDGNTPINPPTECPSCGEDVEWDATKTSKVCTNPNCLSKINANIEHWFKKLGVKGIGSGIISKLTDKDVLSWDDREIVSSLPEMYYMLDNDRRTDHPFRKYQHLKDFFGERAYEKILESIKSVDEVPLAQFIQALGIGQIGRMAKDIVAVAPTVADIDKLTVDEIASLDGFAEKKARSFVNGWKNRRGEIKTLLKYIKIVDVQPASDKLNGMKFCFTGKFANPKRKEMEQMVVDNGGSVSSVSKNLTALVWDGEISGSKVDKAKKLGVDIIEQDDFMKLLD